MIVRFKGGLGNQMFQYVLLKQLEKNYGQKNIKADFSYFTKGHDFFEDRISMLDIHVNRASAEDMKEVCLLPHNQRIHTWHYYIPLFIEEILNRKYYLEKDESFKDLNTLLNYHVLDGYWQSWQYTKGVEDIIMKDLRIIEKCSDATRRQADVISNQNSVFVGVRRGDYLTGKNAKHYYQLPRDYHVKAVQYIAERVENPVFHIFSNDIDWAKKNLSFNNLNVVYREQSSQISDVEEMQLMTTCKHAIIPNSTFHWFGAYLIDNPQKIVVRPEKVFCDGSPEDLYPPTWTIIK